MKTLKVPYLPALDVLDLSSVSFLLEKQATREYIDSVNWPENYPYKPIVAFDIARTNKNLYLRYFVKGNSLKALAEKDGQPVHRDSCVEFFVKPEDSRLYTNLEFNCIGVCDAAHRLSRNEKVPFTQEEYASIRRHSTIEHKPFEEKLGVFSWELVVAIPFATIGVDSNNLPEKLMANFYKCADNTKDPHFLSWNPIDLPSPDFHCPDFFGEIYL